MIGMKLVQNCRIVQDSFINFLSVLEINFYCLLWPANQLIQISAQNLESLFTNCLCSLRLRCQSFETLVISGAHEFTAPYNR